MVPLGWIFFFGRARLEPVRAGPALRGRAAGGSRVGRAELVRARGPISPWGHSGPPRAGDSAGAAVAAGAMCACVRLAAHGGLAAASRCAWPPCGGRAISAVVWRRCGSSFFVGEARAGSRRCSKIKFSAVQRRLGFHTRPAVTGPRLRAAVSRAEPRVRDVRHSAAAAAAAAAAAGRRPAPAGSRLDFSFCSACELEVTRVRCTCTCRRVSDLAPGGVPGPIVNGRTMWQFVSYCCAARRT